MRRQSAVATEEKGTRAEQPAFFPVSEQHDQIARGGRGSRGQRARDFERHGATHGVVAGAGSGLDRVVVRAEQHRTGDGAGAGKARD